MRLSMVLGTRPEVIKLAPVILEARQRGHSVQVILTGQHGDMVLPLLRFFKIQADMNLRVMSPNQTLTGLSGKVLVSLDKHSQKISPDYLITQGDTTSAFVASYWAFCRGFKVAHVEAGLRTHNLASPFPEEANRQMIGRIAALHFAPTKSARQSLASENIESRKIFVVGNTAIDALLLTQKFLRGRSGGEGLEPKVIRWIGERRLVVLTAHRRENFGAPLEKICDGVLKLIDFDRDLCVIYPVHPNPNVREIVSRRLSGHPQILLLDPLPYVSFVDLMRRSSLILTDSGGVQEEAPSLGKPVLVLRDTSERQEGVEKGFSKLIGTSSKKIYRESIQFLRSGSLSKGRNPYGDGRSANRIIDILEKSGK